MTRPRGRPAQGQGVTRDDILMAALALLDEGGGQGLTMRALATRLSVTPMSLYHHIEDRSGLLRALADRVYAGVLGNEAVPIEHQAAVRAILIRYYDAVSRHPQLTLAIFAAPDAFAGVTRHITDSLSTLLAALTDQPELWRDILIDHAHGSALPMVAVHGDQTSAQTLRAQYQIALDRLLDGLAGT